MGDSTAFIIETIKGLIYYVVDCCACYLCFEQVL